MPNTLNIASPRRAAAAAVLLLGLVGCTPPATPTSTSPSSRPSPVSTAPTTVSTWDGAVLHTPDLDIPLRARWLNFSFQGATTLYAVNRRGDNEWHVVHGDKDEALTGWAPKLSTNGQWVAVVGNEVVRVIDDFHTVVIQTIVRHNVSTGAKQVLTLPATTVECCDAGHATLVQSVTNTGVVVLMQVEKDQPLFAWDGAHPPKRIARGAAFTGTWPGGVVVAGPTDPDDPAMKPSSYQLLALDSDLRAHPVAGVAAPPLSWSPDGTSSLSQGAGGFSIGRLRDGELTESPLVLPPGTWTFGAWESDTSLVLGRTGRRNAATAVARCDITTLECVVTTDPPNTSLPNLI